MSREPEAFASVVRGSDALAAAEQRLRREAWVTRRGWELPEQPWSHRMTKVLCLGQVVDERDAEAALVACARTAGVVVDLSGCPDALGRRFLDDLARLALAPAPGRTPPVTRLPLSAEQRALLELVAEGASVPEAAEQLFLSKRTAERRMASIRTALGVASTAAAVAQLRAATRSGGLSGPRGLS
jgi:DNA-binding CsgD family transcriptional regulator